MSFSLSRDANDRYMGRYSDKVASAIVSFAGIESGMRVLDVGCGPGALTEVLSNFLGEESVAAVDPSEAFIAACKDRVPGAEVQKASAGSLPWPDGTFDAVVSQLVLNFLPDADAGVEEMCRVTGPGGVVACCT
ncbi:MAG: methyltransferase domain-containing protein [Aeromicrobium sp.]